MKYRLKILFALLAFVQLGCGDENVGESTANKDPISAAIDALENNRPAEAISILDQELAASPSDPVVLSLLGSAHALSASVDPVVYAIAMGSTAEEGENNITKTFDALPDPTDENIASLETAYGYVAQIPEEDRINEDVFKLSMFYSAHLSLVTKKLNSDGVGGLSAEELANLSEEDALKILESLDAAADVLNGFTFDGAEQEKAAGKISDIQSDIDSSDGASQSEKLAAYLGT